jgi:hypothetical protein
VVLELFLLVGADRDELRAGIVSVKPRPRLLSSSRELPAEGSDSDIVRFLRLGISKEPLPPSGAVVGRRLEPCERVIEWFLLLAPEDFKDDRRSGITTTGIISCSCCFLLRGLEFELTGTEMSDVTLHRFWFDIRPDLCTSRRWEPPSEVIELRFEFGTGELADRNDGFFSVCRRVRLFCGCESMTIASTVDVVDKPEYLQELTRSLRLKGSSTPVVHPIS